MTSTSSHHGSLAVPDDYYIAHFMRARTIYTNRDTNIIKIDDNML